MKFKKNTLKDSHLRSKANTHFERAEFQLCIRELKSISVKTADDFNLLAISQKSVGESAEALRTFELGSQKNPQHFILANNLSAQALAMRQTSLAVDAARQAIHYKADYPEAHYNLGNALMALGENNAAIASYEMAVKLRSEYTKAWLNLGVIYQKISHLDSALQNYSKALECDSQSDLVHHNLANLYYEKGQLNLAFQHAMIAANLQSGSISNMTTLFHMMRVSCHWDQLDQVIEVQESISRQSLDLRLPGEPPFIASYRTVDMAYVRRIAELEIEKFSDIKPMQPKIKSSDHMVIGYLSGDFRNHPVGQGILPAFKLHNREKFKIIACSYGPADDSEYYHAIRENADEVLELRGLSDEQAAYRIRQADIDILVDVTGHTHNSRMAIMAYRPAPIQCLYLGYPGTSGTSFIDYYISDQKVLPPTHAQYFSEKVIYLDNYYHLIDESHPVGLDACRKDQGLPEDVFVFASFTSRYKLTPEWFDLWMQILKRCDHSILWLAFADDFSKNNLISRAVHQGISSDRLFFAPKMAAKADHLARLKLADLIFDTPFYNGMTTTHDALVVGVPVLTVQGSSYPGMVGPALMDYLDLNELVATNAQDFFNKAVDYYSDRLKLSALREQCSKVRDSEVVRAQRVVNDLERVYSCLLDS